MLYEKIPQWQLASPNSEPIYRISLHHRTRHYHGHGCARLGSIAGQMKHRCTYYKLDNHTKQEGNGSANGNSGNDTLSGGNHGKRSFPGHFKVDCICSKCTNEQRNKVNSARIGVYCPAVDRQLYRPPRPGRKSKYAEVHRWPPRGPHRGEKAGYSNLGVTVFDLAS